MSFADNLKKLRGDRSQREVARACDIPASTYNSYELGQRIPRDETKRKLAAYFKTTVQAIFFN